MASAGNLQQGQAAAPAQASATISVAAMDVNVASTPVKESIKKEDLKPTKQKRKKPAATPKSPEKIQIVDLTNDKIQKIEEWRKEAEYKNLSGGTALWPVGKTLVLIEYWEETYIQKGSVGLKPRHWQQVLENVNTQLLKSDPKHEPYTVKQAQKRVEWLKSTHKKEAEKKTGTGQCASTWAFFQAVDQWIGQSPKQTAIPDAVDAGKKVRKPVIDLEDEEVQDSEGEDASDGADGSGDGDSSNAKDGEESGQAAATPEKVSPSTNKRTADDAGLGSEENAGSPATAAKERSAQKRKEASTDAAAKGGSGGKSKKGADSAVKEEKSDLKAFLKMKHVDRKLVQRGGKGDHPTRSSPGTAAKELVTGMKEVVGALVSDMQEERRARTELEHRKLDLLFQRMGGAPARSESGAAQNESEARP